MTSPLRDVLARGVVLFDEGAFFEAHEVWEVAWRGANEPADRLFLQGLIQVAASFHKLTVMSAPSSAARIAERALAKLDLCPTPLHGVDVARLRDAVRASARGMAGGRLAPTPIPRLAAYLVGAC